MTALHLYEHARSLDQNHTWCDVENHDLVLERYPFPTAAFVWLKVTASHLAGTKFNNSARAGRQWIERLPEKRDTARENGGVALNAVEVSAHLRLTENKI
jgi:hypothetical protein